MVEYFIITICFAIMYTLKYGLEITRTVGLAIDTFGLDYENSKWSALSFNIYLFLISMIAMPVMLAGMLFEDRWVTIKRATASILEKHFNFVRKK